MIQVLWFFLLLSWSNADSSGITAEQASFRIIGGYPIDIKEAPYMACLNTCGGSIIGPRHILTAAHCLQQFGSLKVFVGGTEKNKGVHYEIAKITPHPLFDSFNYDAAVITLREPIQFNDKVKAVKLADEHYDLKGVLELHVMGWGRNERNDSHLQKVTVPVYDQAKCRKVLDDFWKAHKNDYFEADFHSETMLCAGPRGGGKDTCQGDSGGPIVDGHGVQVGISSWGYGCALEDAPGVYARISTVVSWVKSLMKADEEIFKKREKSTKDNTIKGWK